MRDRNLKTFLEKEEPNFLQRLAPIRKAVEDIWAHPHHEQFTDHGILHAERVVDNLNALAYEMMGTSRRLCPREAFYLLAAAYLHDVGMQMRRPEKSRVLTEKFGPHRLRDMDTEHLKRAVRDCHALLSAEMIVAGAMDPKEHYDLKVPREDASYLATIVEGHGVEVEALHGEKFADIPVGNDMVRLGLLAAMLRLADGLDLDRRRVNLELLKVEEIEDESKLHWWIHHYVEGTHIEQGTFMIHFRVPSAKYAEPIKGYVLDRLTREERMLRDILWPHEVRLRLRSPLVTYDELREEMPAKLWDLLAKLSAREEGESHFTRDQKLATLQNMSEAALISDVLKPLFERMRFKEVTPSHGHEEWGKDLVFYDEDHFRERHYHAVVVKQGRIHATTSRKGKYSELRDQVKECFEHPAPDPTVGKVSIERCIVVASGHITQQARTALAKDRELYGDRLKFIDGSELVALLDQHMPELFWQEREFFLAYYTTLRTDLSTIYDLQAFDLYELLELDKVYVSLQLEEVSTVQVRSKRKPRGRGTTGPLATKMPLARARMDVVQALARSRRLVIVGDPGTGKTTLLRYMALGLTRQHLEYGRVSTVPILITLRHLAAMEEPDVAEYLPSVFHRYEVAGVRDYLAEKLTTGQCLLLLDGFDEVASREEQAKVATAIQRFAKQYDSCQIVVTSRKAGYHDELKDFAKLAILPLDDGQVHTFVTNWFGEPKADRLMTILRGSERLKTLAQTPLLLSILCIIYRKDDDDIPRRRSDLYKRCIELLLHSWRARRGIRSSTFKPDDKLLTIRKLAADLHRRKEREIDGDELVKFAIAHYPGRTLDEQQARDLVVELHVSNGILREPSRGRYDFLHLSFQEYLAALDLREGPEEVAERVLFDHIKDPWWQEVLLLYLGIRRDATDLMPKIWEAVRKDKELVPFAGSCLVDADWTRKEVKEKVASGIFQVVQREPRHSVDLPTMKANLARVGHHIIRELERFLQDPDWRAVRHASDIIGAISDPDAVEPLLGLMSHPNANVRYSALTGLMNQRGERAEKIVRSTYIIDPGKLRGKKPFEIQVRGRSVVVNEDGKHPGMVFVSDESGKGFWMDVFPVTNAAFEQVFPDHRERRDEFSPHDDSPVVWVTWEQAVEYAKRVGKRLPTEHEWELAGAGPSGLKYPWGNEEDENLCRAGLDWKDGAGRINTVYGDNVSDFGCFEMAGNVWELTADWYDPKDHDYGHAVRGGSWYMDVASCGCGARVSYWHDVFDSFVGFRCCQ